MNWRAITGSKLNQPHWTSIYRSFASNKPPSKDEFAFIFTCNSWSVDEFIDDLRDPFVGLHTYFLVGQVIIFHGFGLQNLTIPAAEIEIPPGTKSISAFMTKRNQDGFQQIKLQQHKPHRVRLQEWLDYWSFVFCLNVFLGVCKNIPSYFRCCNNVWRCPFRFTRTNGRSAKAPFHSNPTSSLALWCHAHVPVKKIHVYVAQTGALGYLWNICL